jgi:hypothetical protein
MRDKDRQREHVYHQDLCRNLVLWAWSRKQEDIYFDEEAVIYVLEQAKKMAEKYECDIPLVEGADQRWKIARWAVATACRMYSTDAEGEKVYVRREHARFAVELLQRCYDSPAMQLDEYARTTARLNKMTPEVEKRLMGEFKEFTDWVTARTTLLDENIFRKAPLQDRLNYEKEEMGKLMKWMNKNRLIVASGMGFQKTPMFIELLKKLDPSRLDGNAELGKDPPF